MLQPKRNKIKIIISLVISMALIAGAILIVFFRQHIIDQITIWQFHPTSAVLNLAQRDGMSDYGKFLYLASQPELDTSSNFNNVCKKLENTSSVLGCFTDSRIYIYNVTDTQLDGIREVTVAHEMLHAAYQRMSDDEKTAVNILLEAEYKKLENNKNFADLIAFYARTEPGERDNELHSVIGTEVASIDPALEAHYGQYFSNRQATVTLYAKYNGAFQNLTNQANALADQLNALVTSIPIRSAQYNVDVQTLNADIVAFNKRAETGDFLSQAQFNSERAALEARVAALDATKASINDDIANYNSILAQYNSIVSQSKKLYSSIDSTLAPTPSVE